VRRPEHSVRFMGYYLSQVGLQFPPHTETPEIDPDVFVRPHTYPISV